MYKSRKPMLLTIETERESTGRWIAEVQGLPGVLVYGRTQRHAVLLAQALALRVMADCLEHGEDPRTGRPLQREPGVTPPIQDVRFATA